MVKGTTPTLYFNVKNVDDFNDVKEIWITVKDHRGRIINKAYSDGEINIDEENKVISCKLGQEETLKLEGKLVKVQVKIRFYDDTIWGSSVNTLPLEEVLNPRLMKDEETEDNSNDEENTEPETPSDSEETDVPAREESESETTEEESETETPTEEVGD